MKIDQELLTLSDLEGGGGKGWAEPPKVFPP